jgi:uncharacterized protein
MGNEDMNPLEENPPLPPDPPEPADGSRVAPVSAEAPLSGDPIPYAASQPQIGRVSGRMVPEDLRITWSWPHLIVFLIYGLASLVIVQTTFAVYYAPHTHLSAKALEQYLISKPQFAVGSMLFWYASLFLFLYVTLAVLRNLPFWRSLGWRKIQSPGSAHPKNPFLYFLAGCGLSLFVALATSQVQTPKDMPMQELFKYRNTALLFMAMAVFIAPLVEETIFRGYLYPVLARSFGMTAGILTTGVLFGLMHGTQLGWTWSLVSLLIFVGIVFTFVRARTGSVFASYMLHLGYNSFIAATALLGTRGFTKFPPGH